MDIKNNEIFIKEERFLISDWYLENKQLIYNHSHFIFTPNQPTLHTIQIRKKDPNSYSLNVGL